MDEGHMPLEFLLCGLGTHGRSVWCEAEIPKIHRSGKARLVGVIDISDTALEYAQRQLGLDANQCFKSIEQAVEATDASFLIESTLPEHRERNVSTAFDCGLDVFMEKPVTGSLASCCRLYEKAKRLGRKAATNFTNRFFREKQSFETFLRSGELGELDYLFTRFGWRVDERPRMYAHGQLLEGSVHALSYLLSFANAKAAAVSTNAWNPRWSVMENAASTNVFIEMENGVRCQMEASWAVRANRNFWGNEYVRADCEKGLLELDNRQLLSWEQPQGSQATSRPIPLVAGDDWGHTLLIDRFIDWVNGDVSCHPTDFDDSLQCMALLFAAMESADKGGERIDVQAHLDAARNSIFEQRRKL